MEIKINQNLEELTTEQLLELLESIKRVLQRRQYIRKAIIVNESRHNIAEALKKSGWVYEEAIAVTKGNIPPQHILLAGVISGLLVEDSTDGIISSGPQVSQALAVLSAYSKLMSPPSFLGFNIAVRQYIKFSPESIEEAYSRLIKEVKESPISEAPEVVTGILNPAIQVPFKVYEVAPEEMPEVVADRERGFLKLDKESILKLSIRLAQYIIAGSTLYIGTMPGTIAALAVLLAHKYLEDRRGFKVIYYDLTEKAFYQVEMPDHMALRELTTKLTKTVQSLHYPIEGEAWGSLEKEAEQTNKILKRQKIES